MDDTIRNKLVGLQKQFENGHIDMFELMHKCYDLGTSLMEAPDQGQQMRHYQRTPTQSVFIGKSSYKLFLN